MASLYFPSRSQPTMRHDEDDASISSLLDPTPKANTSTLRSKSLSDALVVATPTAIFDASLTSLSAPFANIIMAKSSASSSSGNSQYANRCKALKESKALGGKQQSNSDSPVKDHRRRPSLAEEFGGNDSSSSSSSSTAYYNTSSSINCSFRADKSIEDHELENLDELGVSLCPTVEASKDEPSSSPVESSNGLSNFFQDRAQTFSRNLETIGLLILGKRVVA